MNLKIKLLAVVTMAVICSGCDLGPEEPSPSMRQFTSELMSHKAGITDGVSLLDFRAKNRELRTALNQMTIINGASLSAERKQSATWLVNVSVALEKLWSTKVLECKYKYKGESLWTQAEVDRWCDWIILDGELSGWDAARHQIFYEIVELLSGIEPALAKPQHEGGVLISFASLNVDWPGYAAGIDSTISRGFTVLEFCIDEFASGRSVEEIACGRSGDLWGKVKVSRILQTSANEE